MQGTNRLPWDPGAALMERRVVDQDDARELRQLSPEQWQQAREALIPAVERIVADQRIGNYDAARLLLEIANQVRVTFQKCYRCEKTHSGQMPCERSVIETRFGGAR